MPWATTAAEQEGEEQQRRRRRSVEGTPENADARLRQLHEAGVRALRTGDASAARDLLSQALLVRGGCDEVHHAARKACATACFRLGNVVPALQMFWRCASEDPSDVPAWLCVAESALLAHRPALARVASEQALLSSPHNPLLQSLQASSCRLLGDHAGQVPDAPPPPKRLRPFFDADFSVCSESSPFQRPESSPELTQPSPHVTANVRERSWAALLEAIAAITPSLGNAPSRRLSIMTSGDIDAFSGHLHSIDEREDGDVNEQAQRGKMSSDWENNLEGETAQNGESQTKQSTLEESTQHDQHVDEQQQQGITQPLRRSSRREYADQSTLIGTAVTEKLISPMIQAYQQQPTGTSASVNLVQADRERRQLICGLRQHVGVPLGDVESILPNFQPLESLSMSGGKQRRASLSGGSQDIRRRHSTFRENSKTERQNVSDVAHMLEGEEFFDAIQIIFNHLPPSLSLRCAALVRQLDMWLWSVSDDVSQSPRAHLIACQCHLLHLPIYNAWLGFDSAGSKNAPRGKEEREAERIARLHLRKFWTAWLEESTPDQCSDAAESSLYHWLSASASLINSERCGIEMAQRHMHLCIAYLNTMLSDECSSEVNGFGCGQCPPLRVVREQSSELDSRGKLEWARTMCESQQYQAVVEVLAPSLLGPYTLPEGLNYMDASTADLGALAAQQEDYALSLLSKAAGELGNNIAPLKLLALSCRMRAILSLREDAIFNAFTGAKREQTPAAQLAKSAKLYVCTDSPLSSSASEALHHALTSAIAALDTLTHMAIRSIGGSLGKLSGKRGVEKLNEAPAYLLDAIVSVNSALGDGSDATPSESFARLHEMMHALLATCNRCGIKAGQPFADGSLDRVSRALQSVDSASRRSLCEGDNALLHSCFPSDKAYLHGGNHDCNSKDAQYLYREPYGKRISEDATTLQRIHAIGLQMIACRFGLAVRDTIQRCTESEDVDALKRLSLSAALDIYRAAEPVLFSGALQSVVEAGTKTAFQQVPVLKNKVFKQHIVERTAASCNMSSAAMRQAAQSLITLLSTEEETLESSASEVERFLNEQPLDLEHVPEFANSILFVSAKMLSESFSPLGEQDTKSGIDDMVIAIGRLLMNLSPPSNQEREHNAELALSAWATFMHRARHDISINRLRWESWHLLADVLESALETSFNDRARVSPPQWSPLGEERINADAIRLTILKANWAIYALHGASCEVKACAANNSGQWAYHLIQNAPPYYNQISLSPRNSLSSAAYRETIIFAVTCFDNAVNWKGAWEHHLRKGKALEKLGRNDEALDAFMQARVSGSEWLEPHYRLFSSAQKAVLLQRLSPEHVIQKLGMQPTTHSGDEPFDDAPLNIITDGFNDVLDACPYFHKGRWALARGELLASQDHERFQRAADHLSFCFHGPGKGQSMSKGLNIHELDDHNLGLSSARAAELKRRGYRLPVKGRGIADMSRKFISALRKYIVAYVMLRCASHEREGFISAQELTKVTMQADSDTSHPFPGIGDLWQILFSMLLQSAVSLGQTANNEHKAFMSEPSDAAWNAVSRQLALPDLVRLSCTRKGMRWLDTSNDGVRKRLRRIATFSQPSFLLMLDACTVLPENQSGSDASAKLKAAIVKALVCPLDVDSISPHLRGAFDSLPEARGVSSYIDNEAKAEWLRSEVIRMASCHAHVLAQVGGASEVESLLSYVQTLSKRAKTSRLATGTMQQARFAREVASKLCSAVGTRVEIGCRTGAVQMAFIEAYKVCKVMKEASSKALFASQTEIASSNLKKAYEGYSGQGEVSMEEAWSAAMKLESEHELSGKRGRKTMR